MGIMLNPQPPCGIQADRAGIMLNRGEWRDWPLTHPGILARQRSRVKNYFADYVKPDDAQSGRHYVNSRLRRVRACDRRVALHGNGPALSRMQI